MNAALTACPFSSIYVPFFYLNNAIRPTVVFASTTNTTGRAMTGSATDGSFVSVITKITSYLQSHYVKPRLLDPFMTTFRALFLVLVSSKKKALGTTASGVDATSDGEG